MEATVRRVIIFKTLRVSLFNMQLFFQTRYLLGSDMYRFSHFLVITYSSGPTNYVFIFMMRFVAFKFLSNWKSLNEERNLESKKTQVKVFCQSITTLGGCGKLMKCIIMALHHNMAVIINVQIQMMQENFSSLNYKHHYYYLVRYYVTVNRKHHLKYGISWNARRFFLSDFSSTTSKYGKKQFSLILNK